MSKSNTLIIMGSSNATGDTYEVCKMLKKEKGFDFQDLSELVIMPFDYDHDNKDDDFLGFISYAIEKYDHLILATPVYWYNVSGVLKNFIDRFTDLLTIRKDLGKKLEGKSLSLVSVSQKNDIIESFDQPIKLTAEYLKMNWLGHYHFAMEDEASWEVEHVKSI